MMKEFSDGGQTKLNFQRGDGVSVVATELRRRGNDLIHQLGVQSW